MHNWRPAERFDSILDTCLDQIDQSPPEYVLRRYPRSAPQLAPILAVAAGLQQMSELWLPPQARQRVRAQLRQAVLAQQRGQRHAWFGSSLARAAVWAALLVVMLSLGLSTVTVAAASALPHERLYGWKRASEDLWLSVQPTTERKIDVALWAANRRVQETTMLYQRAHTTDDEVVEQIEQSYSRTLNLIAALPPSEEPAFLARVRALGSQHETALAALARQATGIDQQRLGAAVRTSAWVQRSSPAQPFAPPTDPALPLAEPTATPPAPTGTPTPLPTIRPTTGTQNNTNGEAPAPGKTAQPSSDSGEQDQPPTTTSAPGATPTTNPSKSGNDQPPRDSSPKQPGKGGNQGKRGKQAPPSSNQPGKGQGKGGKKQPAPPVPQPTSSPDDGTGGGNNDGKGGGKGKGKP